MTRTSWTLPRSMCLSTAGAAGAGIGALGAGVGPLNEGAGIGLLGAGMGLLNEGAGMGPLGMGVEPRDAAIKGLLQLLHLVAVGEFLG